MNAPAATVKGSLLALAGGLLFATAAHGQARINGRVIDAQNKPMPNIEVLLASVTDSMGHDVDRDTAGADGTFEVVIEKVDPNAVYFVAVRHEGEVYLGELMRPPFPADKEYVVQVGVNPVDLGALSGDEAPPPMSEQDRTAGTVVVIVAAALVGLILFVTFRRRPPQQRRWLVELARLEEELAGDPANREALVRRRAELRARLTG